MDLCVGPSAHGLAWLKQVGVAMERAERGARLVCVCPVRTLFDIRS